MTAESNLPHALAEPLAADVCARAWLEVDLAALRRNAAALAEHAGVPLLPMVKADAYGLGAVDVVRALEPLQPWGFGVATVAEGEALRVSGARRPLLVVTPLLREELPRAAAAGLTPSLHRSEDVEAWAVLHGGAWHLSIDTGMSRAGVRWDEIGLIADAAAAYPPEGAFTHFHSADTDDASRAEQERRFRQAADALCVRPALLHAENSPGIEHGRRSPWSLVRPGVFLYGVESGGPLVPEPVAHLRARVVDVRDVRPGETVSYGATWRANDWARIATVACGYGDGYRRSLGNRGVALLGGVRVPVAGRVTMDMTMLDVTDVACDVGDVATLLGREAGRTGADDDVLTVADVASSGDLSPYELLTGLRLRVPRLYVDA